MRATQAAPVCQICNTRQFKYICPGCQVIYCSVACYRIHKANSCAAVVAVGEASSKSDDCGTVPNDQNNHNKEAEDGHLLEPRPLRPLTSLKWPYIPEAPSYPDPLEKDQPKPLQMNQYEALATSQKIRTILNDNPKIKNILRSIDSLDEESKEVELEHILGVSRAYRLPNASQYMYEDEDLKALQQLAEAVEEAVKGDQSSPDGGMGLAWVDGK